MTHQAMRDLGRVLVTGAQGFLGAALIDRLRGNPVTATDLASPDHACDLTEFEQVLAVVQGGFDTIFHCGAVSGPMVMADRPLDIWRINALGTAHVLEAARRTGRPRVVVCSTSEVYGPLPRMVDEHAPPHPMSIYAASKLAAEQAALGYVREHGVDAVILRLSWIYGPGRRTPTNLESVLSAILAGQQAQFDAGADEMTHYLHIDDAVAGLLCAGQAAALPHRIYNITAGVGVPLRDIARILTDLHPEARLVLPPDGPIPGGATAIDNHLAARDLGFSPAVTLTAGLAAYLRALQG